MADVNQANDSPACEQCGRQINRARPGTRFCSMDCRGAYHRQRGKAVSGQVQSVSPCKNGACVVVVRVPAEHSARSRAWLPGQPVEVLERAK